MSSLLTGLSLPGADDREAIPEKHQLDLCSNCKCSQSLPGDYVPGLPGVVMGGPVSGTQHGLPWANVPNQERPSSSLLPGANDSFL